MWVSVTECLSIFDRYSGVHPDVLRIASERGTLVHKHCLSWAEGFYMPTPDEIKPEVEQFKRWFDLAVDSVLCTEKEMRCEKTRLLGHVDLILKFRKNFYPSDGLSVVDLKHVWKVDWTVGLQLAGYEYLSHVEYPNKQIARRFALQIPKGQRARLIPFADPDDIKAFWYAYSLRNHANKPRPYLAGG